MDDNAEWAVWQYDIRALERMVLEDLCKPAAEVCRLIGELYRTVRLMLAHPENTTVGMLRQARKIAGDAADNAGAQLRIRIATSIEDWTEMTPRYQGPLLLNKLRIQRLIWIMKRGNSRLVTALANLKAATARIESELAQCSEDMRALNGAPEAAHWGVWRLYDLHTLGARARTVRYIYGAVVLVQAPLLPGDHKTNAEERRLIEISDTLAGIESITPKSRPRHPAYIWAEEQELAGVSRRDMLAEFETRYMQKTGIELSDSWDSLNKELNRLAQKRAK